MANWRTGIGAPSWTNATEFWSATKDGSEITAASSKESCSPRSSNCTPALWGPSAARKSAMMVCVIAVVLVRLAGVVAARTRYDAVVSFGQDFASRRAAAAGCSALDSPPLRPMQSATRTSERMPRSRLALPLRRRRSSGTSGFIGPRCHGRCALYVHRWTVALLLEPPPALAPLAHHVPGGTCKLGTVESLALGQPSGQEHRLSKLGLTGLDLKHDDTVPQPPSVAAFLQRCGCAGEHWPRPATGGRRRAPGSAGGEARSERGRGGAASIDLLFLPLQLARAVRRFHLAGGDSLLA